MAKKVYPVASFEPCDNEVPMTFDMFARISLLAPLPAKTKENMEKCPGALRLRRFRANDLICRQGEEDCTAFFLLTAEDVLLLRNYPAKRSFEIEAEKNKLDAKRKELDVLVEKALGEAKAKEADKLRKQMTEVEEKLVSLEREREQMPALTDAANTLPEVKGLDILQAGAEANRQLEQLEKLAMSAGEPQRAATLHDLRCADSTQKRSQAPKENAEVARLLIASAEAADMRRAAIVHLSGAAYETEQTDGWLQRLKRNLVGGRSKGPDLMPLNIPFDGPAEISSRTRQAILSEGELFGEMACLNRAPRSATVLASRECYILEMLSNILTEIDKDPRYQEERNRTYQERVLNGHLRDLMIFRNLTDADFARVFIEVRGQVQLKSFSSGELICDEYDRPDHVYLVRSGLVQVKKNAGALLSIADVVSWRDLGSALREDGSAAAVGRLLQEPIRQLVSANADSDRVSPTDAQEIVYALNDIIKDRNFASLPECKEAELRCKLHDQVRGAAAFQTQAVFEPKELEEVIKTASLRQPRHVEPGKVQHWSELDHRRLNRLLLEAVLPGCLKPLPRHSGPDTVLVYRSRGESIGEIGVCKRQPRSATCIAFGQPRGPKQEDLSRVEMVQIPGEVFRRLMEQFPTIRANVEAEITRREALTEKRMEETRPGTISPREPRELERLGLIQGQKLMLIDMEKCTLCGECVRGCVDSHADGRSRLFLVGHRFDKYMVPITCRSCLDPVCMIECPVRSIQRGDNHEIVIKDWCIGCQKCARNCPYDAIKMHDLPTMEGAAEDASAPFRIREEIAVVCDLCSSLADQNPRCVYACPHDAAMRVNARLELPLLSQSAE